MCWGRARLIKAACTTIFIGSAIAFGLSLNAQAGHTPSRGETLFLVPRRSLAQVHADPLDGTVTALLSRGHPPRPVQMNISLSASATNNVRLTVVAVVHIEARDPILASFLDGSLIADDDTDSVFGTVDAGGPAIFGSNPDAESVIINSLSSSITVTREQVWTLSTDGNISDGLVELGWSSANAAIENLYSNHGTPSADDMFTTDFHIGDARLLAYNGANLPRISGSNISVTRSGKASIDMLLAPPSIKDEGISVTLWPCGQLSLGECFSYTDPDALSAPDYSGYSPSSATQVFEIFLALAAAGPLALALGYRRPWKYRPRQEWVPLAAGTVFIVVGTGWSYVIGVIPDGYLPYIGYSVGALVGLSLSSVIALYIAYGAIGWIRWTLWAVSLAAAAGDIAYLYAAYRVSTYETVLLVGLATTTLVGSFAVRRDLKAAIGVSALTVAFNLEYASWVGVRNDFQAWLGRLPYALVYLQETWVPISVSLVSIAAVDTYVRRSGLRRWRFFPALYPLAAALALVPGIVLHPNANYSQSLYSAPYDYWLSWWAALSVFTACAAIRLVVLGRTAECYRKPQVKRLSIAVAAIICMMLFYNGSSSQYESGAVAVVVIISLMINLPAHVVDKAAELTQSSAASYAETVNRYAHARALLAAYNQLRRDKINSLASGELGVDEFNTRSEELLRGVEANGGVGAAVRERVFGVLIDESPARAGAIAAVIALAASAPIVAFDLTGLPEPFIKDIAQVPLITSLWQAVALERWAFYGFLFGYFYPLLRGHSSTAKAWRFAVALIPTELTLTWISNVPVQPGTLLLSAGETIAFFLVLGAAWEIRMVVRSGIAWTEVRSLRGVRGVLAPLGALAVAAVTAAVPVLTSTVAPTSPQQAQPQVQVKGQANSPSPTQPSRLPSDVAWPTGAETVLPCMPSPAASSAAAALPSQSASCASTQSPTP